MPRYAANLTMLFNEVGFLDRFDAAARAGFSGVEYLFPYEYDKQELLERLHKHRLTQVLHNLPAGDWAAGERGIACHPDRTSEFASGVDQAIDYATTLECAQVNCLAGIVPPGVSRGAGARDVRQQSAIRRAEAGGRRHPPADRADQHARHPRLLPDAHRRRRSRSSKRSDPTISSCSTTSITCRSWKAICRARSSARSPKIAHIQIADPPGTQRTRHRRDQLHVPLEPHRSPRLSGLDRPRVSTGRTHRSRPRMDQAIPASQ